jgi:CRISPR system Cascade subunit CasA
VNLLSEPWLPARRRSGSVEWIAPHQITDSQKEDPFVGITASRPDFTVALYQFLIGLLQTTVRPDSSDDWLHNLLKPPSPAKLREKFLADEAAFEFVQGKRLFLQDVDLATDDPTPIPGLLIDSPGTNTISHNKDLFIKRGLIENLCPACAATALFTLQTNAPSGGQGHRTSLRGGGPLTTLLLVDPNSEQATDIAATLWHDLWLNVLDKDQKLAGNARAKKRSDIYPWLDATRTSEKQQKISAQDVNPLQAYWGMPRRVLIDHTALVEGNCDVCGRHSSELRTQYFTHNYGMNYAEDFEHPLSPYRLDKNNQHFPLHPQPGGLAYRHWLSFLYGNPEQKNAVTPALVIRTFHRRQTEHLKLSRARYRLWCAGFDMDNMKARAWYEARMPVILVLETARERYEAAVRSLIDAAVQIAGNTRQCVALAWKDDTSGNYSVIADDFFQRTEARFYDTLRAVSQQLQSHSDQSPQHEGWYGVLKRTSEEVFADFAETGTPDALTMRRIVKARRNLLAWNNSRKLKQMLGIYVEDATKQSKRKARA